jgi:hypothetical protein
LEEQLLIGFVEYEAGRGVELIEEPDLAGHGDDHLEVVRAVLEHLHARVLRVYLRVAEVAKGSYRRKVDAVTHNQRVVPAFLDIVEIKNIFELLLSMIFLK